MENFIHTFIDRETGLYPMLRELDQTFNFTDIFNALVQYYNNEMCDDSLRQLYSPDDGSAQALQLATAANNVTTYKIFQDTTQTDLSGDDMAYRAAQELTNLKNSSFHEWKPMAAVPGRPRHDTPIQNCNVTAAPMQDYSMNQGTGYMQAISWGDPNANQRASGSRAHNQVEQVLLQGQQTVTLPVPSFGPGHQIDHIQNQHINKRDHRGDVIKLPGHGIKEETKDLRVMPHCNRSLPLLPTDTFHMQEPSKYKSGTWKEAFDLLNAIRHFNSSIDASTVNYTFSQWINAATSAKPDQKPVKTSYRRFGDSLDQEYKRLYGEDEAKRQGKLERKHRMKIWKEVEGTMIEVKFKALELEALVKACDEPVGKRAKMG